MVAAGSLGLITLSALAAGRSPPRRAAHAAALLVGTAAIFYLAAYHGGLLDLIIDTWRAGPE
jgi:hypothetical protein